MRALRAVLTAASVVMVVAVVVVAAAGGLVDDSTAVPIALVVVDAVLAAVAGWLVLSRSAWPALGVLVQLMGVWIVVAMLRHVVLGAAGLEVSGGLWLAGACLPAIVVWGFPDGMGRRRRRWVVGTAVLVAVVGAVPAVLGGSAGPGTTTANLDAVLPVRPGARVALAVQSVMVVGFTATALVDLVRRRRRDSAAVDPSAGVVIGAGAAWLLALVVERVVHLLPVDDIRSGVAAGPVDALRPWAGFAGINVVLTALGLFVSAIGYAVVVRPRLDRLPDGTLALDDRAAGAAVEDLPTFVGDPTLQVRYAGGRGGWVDEHGMPVAVDPGAGQTLLLRQGVPIAVVVHDPALSAGSGVVRYAAAVVAGAIDATAAAAAAEARVVDARSVASRLVSADHATRVALIAELEAGPLHDLAECVGLLEAGSELGEVTTRLRLATAETRRISHGLYPPELLDSGLGATLDRRTGAPTRRLPRAVEVTAYLLARDDPGATFVDRGTMLDVQLTSDPEDGAALDRVAVLGGSSVGSLVTIPTGGV